MDQTTLLWTLAGTFFAGVALFMQKIVAEERRNGAFNGMLAYGVTGLIAFALLLVSIQNVPANWGIVAFFGLTAGAVHGICNFLRIESLKYIDSVLFFPLNKVLAPLIVVIGAVALFQDNLSVVQYVGIALSLTVPLLLITSVERTRQKNLSLGLRLLVISAVLSAVSLLLTKQGLGYSSDILFILCMSQITGTLASVAILLRQHGAGFAMFAHADWRDVKLGIWSGIFMFISSYCLFEALSTGLASIVYVIQAHYILIPIVLSVWWYRDHINMRKFAAVVVSFFAIALLAL